MSLIDFLLGRPSERDLLLQIREQNTTMEVNMSALDDSVAALTTEINTVLTDVVQSLKEQLAAAQADDATAAGVAADVQENVTKLDELRAKVASFEPSPTEPTEPTV